MEKISDKKKLKTPHRKRNDIIDEASKESFPTSDPPAWTLGTDTEVAAYLKHEKDSLTHHIASDHILLHDIVKLIRKTINDLEQNKTVAFDEMTTISDFLCVFLDKIHQQKSEVLYPELKVGADEQLTNYMISSLRDEHAEGKHLLSQLNKIVKHHKQLNNENKTQILSLLKDIEHLYSNHLAKEEEYVLPFVKKALSEETQSHFLKIFNQIEKQYQSEHQKIKEMTKDV